MTAQRGGSRGRTIAVLALVALAGTLVACGGAAAETETAKVPITRFESLFPTTVADAPKASATLPSAAAPAPAMTAAEPVTTTAWLPDAGTPDRPWRIMALGDSITQGADPTDLSTPQTYRGALYRSLVEAGYHVDMVGSDRTPTYGGGDADGEGHGGYSIGPDGATLCEVCGPANVAENVDAWVQQSRPDIVLLLIGMNDLFPITERRNGALRPVVPAEAPDKLTGLVAQIQANHPEVLVFVASYPPVPLLATNSGQIGVDFAALNAAARTAGSTGDRAYYVPLAEELATNWAPGDTGSDNVHPTAEGATKMADVFFRSLTSVIGPPPAG